MTSPFPPVSTDPLILSVNQTEADVVMDGEGFVLADDGLENCTLKIDGDLSATETWLHKQDDALAEYLEHHVQEDISAESRVEYKCFGAYIGNVLHALGQKKRTNILDVGCGIGTRLPLYMRHLVEGVNYVGLDAIDINLTRDYPFICARAETLGHFKAFHNTFDMFVFGTSLDHFENIGDIARAVRAMAAPGARVVFWVGLHDSPLVARAEGARALERIFEAKSTFTILSRLARFIFWSFPRLFMVLWQRQAKLKSGQGLDDLHFWYFQEKDMPGVFSQFGEIVDISTLPGGNSVFVTCRIADGNVEDA